MKCTELDDLSSESMENINVYSQVNSDDNEVESMLSLDDVSDCGGGG